jgi:SAM-dependent methyltransferase
MTRPEAHDPIEFWDSLWSERDEPPTGPDDLLAAQTSTLTPGRALDIGCGAGANAVWLAERGWKVTAVDFAKAAIEQARRLAGDRGVDVEFVVADAASYKPNRDYDLITSFYIQLPPRELASMLRNSAGALSPGGTLLFVSHDRSSPPPGWTDEDLETLTTPDGVASGLSGLEVLEAYVLEHDHGGAHASPAPESEAGHDGHDSDETDDIDPGLARTTVVRAVRPVENRARPRSLGIGASGHQDTARRAGEERTPPH